MNETKKPEKEKSMLEQLLEKNAYGEGLTEGEYYRAWALIANPEYSEKDCWVCPKEHKDKAIYDTGLCQGHAHYALVTRK